jgi:uncharacterized membrane-anchored protein
MGCLLGDREKHSSFSHTYSFPGFVVSGFMEISIEKKTSKSFSEQPVEYNFKSVSFGDSKPGLHILEANRLQLTLDLDPEGQGP